MKFSRRSFLAGISAALASTTALTPAQSWVHGLGVTSFNGRVLQANMFAPSFGHDYPWLNLMKGSQNWSFNSGNAPLTPDMLDSNGYLITLAGNASSGIFTLSSGPSQEERSGLYVYKWTGNGTVSSGSTSATTYSIQITGVVSNTGGRQVYQLSASPSLFVAGMPIAISGLSGGTWAGANATVAIESVDTVSNRITINTGTTFTGSATVSGSAAVTCVTTTTVSNGSGLTGFGRYIIQPVSSLAGKIGGNIGQSFYCSITNIASSVDYPKDIVLCHVNDEAKIAAGKIFSDIAISIYSQFGCIRFLGWQYGFSNFTNVSTWDTRKRTTHVSWAADQLRSDLYCATTTQSVDATGCIYNASVPSTWPGIADKATIQFNPDKSQNASVTALASDGLGNTIVTLTTGGVNTSFAEGGTVVIGGVDGSLTTPTVWARSVATGSISGTTLTITALASGYLSAGQFITQTNSGGAIASNTTIVQQLTGTPGGIGTYQVSISQTVSSVGVQANGLNGTFSIVPGSVASGSLKVAVDCSAFAGSATLTGAICRHQFAWIKVGSTTTTKIASYNQSTPVTNIVAGTFASLVTAVYDSTLGYFLYCGGSASTSIWLANFVPPEIMFELCIATGAQPHFIMPQYSCCNITDWLPQVMLLGQSYLPRAPWLKPRFEGPNELWNTDFPQTQYSSEQTKVFSGWGGSGDSDNWYGMVMSLMGQVGKAVYGTYPGASSNYAIIAGIQTASARLLSTISASRFESTKFLANGPAPPSLVIGGVGTIAFSQARAAGTTAQGGTTATNYITHIAPATYWSPNSRASTTGYPVYEYGVGGLDNAFNGCVIGSATITAGVITVGTLTFGTLLSDGSMSLIGPDGTVLATITSQLSGTTGQTGTYQLSNALNIPTVNAYYCGVDMTAPGTLEGFAYDAVFNGTISGSTLTINSYTSGFIGPTGELATYIYGGTIVQGSQGNVQIVGMTDATHFTLSGSPGNQTANFKAGNQFSIDGVSNLYVNAANFALNHNVVKMCAYEGDYSPDYPNNTSNSVAAQLRRQSKYSATLKAHTTTNWDNFLGRGAIPLPGGMTSEFPSVYLPVGPYPSSNVWSVNEDGYVRTSPRWQAIQTYQ